MIAAPVRVLLADDQRLVRESLGTHARPARRHRARGQRGRRRGGARARDEHQPQVVLMDLRMPRLDGIEATRLLRERHPDVRVIALTTYADDESVLGALRAGARGYLTKDASSEDIRTAIHTVAAGDAALDPSVQHHVVAALASEGAAHGDPSAAVTRGATRRPHATRGGGARADRRGTDQRRDRRAARRQPSNDQVPRQPPVRQGRPPRPRAGGQLRLPYWDRNTATLKSTVGIALCAYFSSCCPSRIKKAADLTTELKREQSGVSSPWP